MTGEQYIYKNNNRFRISKSIDGKTKAFGNYGTLEEAILVRDLLIEHHWNLDELVPYDNILEFNGEFLIVKIFHGTLKIITKFKTFTDAWNNVEICIADFERNPYGRNYGDCIYNVGKYFDVKKSINNDEVLFGRYKRLDDAIFARDLLVKYDWDLMEILKGGPIFFSQIHDQYIVAPVINGKLDIIEYYNSKIDAILNVEEDIAIHIKYQNMEKHVEHNGNSNVCRYIQKKDNEFWIRKKIGGEVQFLGPYNTKSEAIEARDEYELNGWQLDNPDEESLAYNELDNLDEESLFYNGLDDEDFEDIVFNLSMWQKIVYDTIVRIGTVRFSLDEILNHNYLKCYKSGKNFDEKVINHLNELIDWGLVESLGDNMYLRKF